MKQAAHKHRRQPAAGDDAARKAKLAKVKAEFARAGVSVSEWARANGFERMTVVDVLRGVRVGHRGEAHKVAIALGLKEGRVVDPKAFKPAGATR